MNKEEIKGMIEALSGMAQMCFTYYKALRDQGFSESQAMQITLDWQRATIQRPQESTPLQQFLDRSPS